VCSLKQYPEVCMRGRFVLCLFFSMCCLLVLLLATREPALAQVTYSASGNEAKAIERVLRTQQEAWNHHDLEGFMAGYWNSPELTFFSEGKEQDGWQATLDRYLAKYAGPGHAMGKLEFSSLRVEVLSQDAAFVRGAWKVTMPDAKTPHGLFTLVFRKFPGGWKIVHDHTSAAG
jgi:ketosteroid isomerase-like protein